MKIRYVADDGKMFLSEEECKKYESKCEEQLKRREEIEKAYNKYLELREAYSRDYYDFLKGVFGI